MTGLTAYILLGLLLPLAGGVGLARALFPAVFGARAAEWLGAGLLVGPAIASLAMHLAPWDSGAGAWLGAGLLLALAVAGSLLPAARPGSIIPMHRPGGARLLGIIAGIAAAGFLVQVVFIAQEVLWRPTFPWDAWAAWAYKAKAWYLAGGMPEFVEPGQWPAADGASGTSAIYPVTAPHYPTLVAGIQVYLATWLGNWREPLLNMPWLMVHAAVVLLLYGEGLRILGHRSLALLLAGLVGSIPLFATHTALAGYMDLWVAAALLAFCICLVRMKPGDGMRPVAITVLLAGMLTMLKVEAVMWVAVALLAMLPHMWAAPGGGTSWWRHLRSGPALTGIGLLCALVAAWAGIRVSLPYFGELSFGFNPEADAILVSLFASWNWHLFFAILAACLVADACLRSRSGAVEVWRRLALAGLLAVGALCLVTRVSGEATDITNYNRIILHWVPVWAVYAAAVIVDVMPAWSRPGGSHSLQ